MNDIQVYDDRLFKRLKKLFEAKNIINKTMNAPKPTKYEFRLELFEPSNQIWNERLVKELYYYPNEAATTEVDTLVEDDIISIERRKDGYVIQDWAKIDIIKYSVEHNNHYGTIGVRRYYLTLYRRK